jgi:hypothetical protein
LTPWRWRNAGRTFLQRAGRMDIGHCRDGKEGGLPSQADPMPRAVPR